MIPDTRIKWQVLSNNGDDTTTEKGIIMSPICVQEFVEQIVFPDKKTWGEIQIGDWTTRPIIEFAWGRIKIINQRIYDNVKTQYIKSILYNGGWSSERFIIEL